MHNAGFPKTQTLKYRLGLRVFGLGLGLGLREVGLRLGLGLGLGLLGHLSGGLFQFFALLCMPFFVKESPGGGGGGVSAIIIILVGSYHLFCVA